MSRARVILVIGWGADGLPLNLYTGPVTDQADAAFRNPPEGIVHVEQYRFPMPTRRRAVQAAAASPAPAADPTDLSNPTDPAANPFTSDEPPTLGEVTKARRHR